MSFSRIYSNTDARLALNYLDQNQNIITKTLRRLSTGLRITTGADDPSGLAIAAGLQTRISGTEQAIRNAEDGVTMLQLADSSLNETASILFRMKDLAIKAANTATITTANITTINSELQTLKLELTRKSTAVTYNSKILFSGGFTAGFALQVGPDNLPANMLTVSISGVTLTNLQFIGAGWGATGSLIISNEAGVQSATGYAQQAMDYIASAINIVSSVRANLGVQQARLNYTINDLSSQDVNLTSALSNIRDADMASEIAEFARLQVISQANIAMLAQANMAPQQVLSLLTGSMSK